jgi:hypothetical protein
MDTVMQVPGKPRTPLSRLEIIDRLVAMKPVHETAL